MERTLPSIIKQKTDITSNWASKNPILAKGQIGFEITTTGEIKQKVGDGTSTWDKLTYLGLNISDADIRYLQSTNPSYPNTYVNWNTDFLEVSNGKCSLGFDPNFILAEGETNSGPCLWSKEKVKDGSEYPVELSIVSSGINLYDEDGDLGWTSIHGVYTRNSSDPTDAASKEYVDKHTLANGGTIEGSLKMESPTMGTPAPTLKMLGDADQNWNYSTASFELSKDVLSIGVTNLNNTNVGTIISLNAEKVSIGKTTPTSGPIQLSGVDTPTLDNDAVNKKYVDSNFLSLVDGGAIVNSLIVKPELGRSGVTFRLLSSNSNGGWYFDGFEDLLQIYCGILSGSKHGQINIQNVGKIWILEDVFVQLGNLNSSGSRINGLALPQSNTDAANKQYVDSSIASIPTYTLPTASTSTLGGVKIGANVNISEDGTISVAVPGISQEMADGRYLQFANPNSSVTNNLSWTSNSLKYTRNDQTLDFANVNSAPCITSSSSLQIRASELTISQNPTGYGKIRHLAPPTEANDAANKAYVDSVVANSKGIYGSQIVTSGTIASINGIQATATSDYPLAVSLTPNMIFVSAYCKFNSSVSLNSSMTIFLSSIRINGAKLNFSTFTNMCSGILTKLDGNGKLIETMTIQKLVWHNDYTQFSFDYNQQSGGVTPFTYAQVNLFAPIIT